MAADYPNVPSTAGVPPIKRDATNPGTDTVDQLDSDGADITVAGTTEWGVYRDGKLALEPDAIIEVSYDAEHRIADFPIEEGGFETYDKVSLPAENRVVMTKGGGIDERRAFLAAVEELRGDTELYSVVTPERTYLDVNFSRVSINRSREKGAGLITVELQLREVRQNATATFSSSKEPASEDTKSDGTVQAQDAPAEVQARAETKIAANAPASSGTIGANAPSFIDRAGTAAMKVIPLVAGIPSQSLTVNLGQQVVQAIVSQKRTGMFADILVAGTQIAQGVMCRDGVPLLDGVAPQFLGDLAFIDMIGDSDPVFSELGDRFKLVWAA